MKPTAPDGGSTSNSFLGFRWKKIRSTLGIIYPYALFCFLFVLTFLKKKSEIETSPPEY